MKSRTKARISEDKIIGIAAKWFPGAGVSQVTELKGGMFNAAYLIMGTGALEGGAVVKVGPAKGTKVLTYERDIMTSEVEVYRQLSAKSIPLPKLICADFDRDIIDSDYFITEYIPHTVWNKADKKKISRSKGSIMSELGRYTAVVHSVKGEHFGYNKIETGFAYDNWYDAFFSMMQNIVGDGKNQGYKLCYDKILSAVAKHRKFLEEVSEPSLVAFDMWAGNIFLKYADDKYTISGFIDFERAFYGDPYADFVAAMFIYKDVEQEPEFIRGYESKTCAKLVIGESERTRMMLYRLYLNVILFTESYRYGRVFAYLTRLYAKANINKLLKSLNKS